MAAVDLVIPLINSVEREEEVELDGGVEEPGLIRIRTNRSRVQQNEEIGKKEEIGKDEKSVYFNSDEGSSTESGEENDSEKSKTSNNGGIKLPNVLETEKKLEFDVAHGGKSHHTATEIESIITSVLNKELVLDSHRSEIKINEPIEKINELKDNATDIESILTSVLNKELVLGSHRSEIKSDEPIEEANKLKGTVPEIRIITTSKVNKELVLDSHPSEIKSDEPIEETNELKETVEYDVEKVLDEQETHDLFCPKCQSCITKRVILRKRKQIGKPLQSEGKRGKLPVEEVDVGDDLVDPFIPDQPQRREAFGCFECFSFFISTAGGFKLFSIFGKKQEVSKQQNSVVSSSQITHSSGQTVITILPSPHHERDIGSKDKGESGSEENAAKVSQVTPILESRNGDQILEISQQNTTLITNVGSSQTTINDQRITVMPSPHLEVDIGRRKDAETETSGKAKTASKQHDQKVINGMASPHHEVDLGQQKGAETNGKLKTDSKQHGFQFFRFFGQKYSNQKLETYEQNTTIISNIGGVISDGLNGSKTSIAESVQEIAQIDGVRELLPESILIIPRPAAPPEASTEGAHRVDIGPLVDERPSYQWDILKTIVYGGLVELITSLGVISSAAGSNSTTLNIFVLALANLVGGLTVLVHNLKELISSHRDTDQTSVEEDKYFKTLGLRANYRLHIVFAIISYFIFGLLPPIIYGFSFRKSDDRNSKIIATAGASLFCILLLAIGKAHVQHTPKPYIKTMMYYLSLGVASSGLSFAVGELVKRALEGTGLFNSTTGGSTPNGMIDSFSTQAGWGAY